MSSLTLPYPAFADGVDTVDAITTNANNAAIATSVNAIDRTNMGPAGIDATSIIPGSNAAATFAAGLSTQYTFPVALIVSTTTTTAGLTSTSLIRGTNVASGNLPGTLVLGDSYALRSATTGRFQCGDTTSYAFDGGIVSATNISILKNGASIATINGTTGVYVASDARLKENIEPLPSGMLVIQALKPSTFTWKETGAPDVGFIAQEVQPLIPHAVITMEDETGKLGLAPVAIIPYLVRAVQELKAEFDAYVAAHP